MFGRTFLAASRLRCSTPRSRTALKVSALLKGNAQGSAFGVLRLYSDTQSSEYQFENPSSASDPPASQTKYRKKPILHKSRLFPCPVSHENGIMFLDESSPQLTLTAKTHPDKTQEKLLPSHLLTLNHLGRYPPTGCVFTVSTTGIVKGSTEVLTTITVVFDTPENRDLFAQAVANHKVASEQGVISPLPALADVVAVEVEPSSIQSRRPGTFRIYVKGIPRGAELGNGLLPPGLSLNSVRVIQKVRREFLPDDKTDAAIVTLHDAHSASGIIRWYSSQPRTTEHELFYYPQTKRELVEKLFEPPLYSAAPRFNGSGFTPIRKRSQKGLPRSDSVKASSSGENPSSLAKLLAKLKSEIQEERNKRAEDEKDWVEERREMRELLRASLGAREKAE